MSLEDTGRPSGLADRLDDLLYRLDGLRARPGLLALFVLLLLGGVVLAVRSGPSSGAPPLEELLPMADGATSTTGIPADDDAASTSTDADAGAQTGTEAEEDDPPDLVVHVVGAVRNPGLVTVPAGSRIGDVLVAAGGAVDGADVQRLNLAAPAGDGMQVRVPRSDDGEELDDLPLIVQPAPPPAARSDGPSVNTPVNLNTAEQSLLETLPGIGPATAAAIITWRDDNGPFARTEDLLDVPGIGPVKLAALSDHVTT